VDRDEARAQAIAAQLADGGARATALQADVSDPASVAAMVEQVRGELGRVDILVNNAAIYPRREWTEITPEEWDEVLGINLRGYYLCARAAFDSMREGGWGRVVNVASITFFLGYPHLLDYVASKGGVIGFTRSLSREVGPHGITVNAIAPGAFPTDAEKIHPNPEEYNQFVLDQQSIKRRGTPEDIGNLVVFFASDAASFITGQTIAIDGGWVTH
jgi:NAD(P)-dependent dehydrogenase (short-subunit alcohol dehydrogenase family)